MKFHFSINISTKDPKDIEQLQEFCEGISTGAFQREMDKNRTTHTTATFRIYE